MDKVTLDLLDLGLTKNEIDVYLTLLSVGSAPASVLGNRLGMNRSTAWYTCTKLRKKGLVNRIQQGETHFFNYEPPTQLKELIHKKRKELDDKELHLNGVIKHLEEAFAPQVQLPKVQLFEGIEGVKKVYEDIIRDVPQQGELLSFLGDGRQMELLIAKQMNDFVHKRVEKKVRHYVIGFQQVKSVTLKKTDKDHLRKICLLPKGSFKNEGGELMVCNHKLYSFFVEGGGLFVSVTESETLAQMQRQLFWFLWNRFYAVD